MQRFATPILIEFPKEVTSRGFLLVSHTTNSYIQDRTFTPRDLTWKYSMLTRRVQTGPALGVMFEPKFCSIEIISLHRGDRRISSIPHLKIQYIIAWS